MADEEVTTFQEMYDFFLAGITDDMFMELTKEDTEAMLEEILLAALPHFEFPRFNIYDVDIKTKTFPVKLNLEEMLIIREYMIVEWLGMQLATVDLIRQKFSGSDFKFTSQASHIKQLQALKEHYQTQAFHQQRIYCRQYQKKHSSGIGSSFGKIMGRERDD